MPDLNGVLKFVHVAFAAFWVGGGVLIVLYGLAMRRVEVGAKIAHARMMLTAGRYFAIFAAIALIAGVWLVLRIEVYGFDQAWISIGFLGIIAGAALGPAFYAPQSRALIAELEAGNPAAAARAQRIGTVGIAEMALLIVVVWAMVYRPGL